MFTLFTLIVTVTLCFKIKTETLVPGRVKSGFRKVLIHFNAASTIIKEFYESDVYMRVLFKRVNTVYGSIKFIFSKY
jgi:hypothetical protein